MKDPNDTDSIYPTRKEDSAAKDLLRGMDCRKLIGKKVRFHHQPDGPDRIISGCNLDGMVSIHGFSGWFAPDLFVEVKERE